jgi:type II secretory pathway component PulF
MLASLTSLLEPILILIMGFIVGFIVISVFLPLYQIIGNIK